MKSTRRHGRTHRAMVSWGIGGLAVLALAGHTPVPAGSTPARQDLAPPGRAASLVFDGVTVVDVDRGVLVPNQRVVIQGRRIQAMGPAARVRLPPRAQVVQAQGKYLMPGLWDLHVHPRHLAPDYFYPLLLAHGVTGFRDPGSDVSLDTLIEWRREIVAGERVGPPRQILVGQYLSQATPRPGTTTPSCQRSEQKGIETCVSPTGDDAQHLVDSLRAAGADMIKVYNVSHDLYFALAAAARRIGIPFGGHLYPWVAIADASDSGASIIDHLGNGVRSGELDSLCLNATASVARCQPLAERLRRNGTWWVPTLTLELSDKSALLQRYQQLSHEFWQSDTVLRGKWHPIPLVGGRGASPDSAVDALARLLHIAAQVDLPILAGTDALAHRAKDICPGLSLHGELAAYVAGGLTPASALRTATLNPAKLLRATDSLGTVAAGKLADVVLLDADPLADITNTLAIRAVVANGRYFDRAALDRILAEVKTKTKQPPQALDP